MTVGSFSRVDVAGLMGVAPTKPGRAKAGRLGRPGQAATGDRIVPKSILYEVAPPLMDGSRSAVVGVLHRLLCDPVSMLGKTAGIDNALRLAALNCRLAECVLADLGVGADLPRVQRWQTQMQPGSVRVSPWALSWPPLGAGEMRPLPLTGAFLEALPDRLALTVMRWAPPVVAPASARGEHRVVANHVSALLARQKLRAGDVRVRCLAHSTSLARTLTEICQAIALVLSPLCDRHRDRILRLAHDEVEGRVFTGLRRAQYFRVTAQGR